MTRVLATGCVVGVALASATAIQASPATPTAPKVTVLAAGSAPRTPLRLSLKAGAVSTGDLVTALSVEQTFDGEPQTSVTLPPIRMTQTTRVDSVAENGDAEITFNYVDAQVVDDGSADDATREQLEAALAPITDVSGHATVTPRNVYLATEFEGTESLPATTAELMKQLSQQSSSLSVPFPEEPVGVGARWRVTTPLDVNGIEVRQQYEYRLRGRDGNRLTVDLRLVQTAARQQAQLPGVPAGTKIELTRFRTTGDGNGTIDLATTFPVEMDVHASGRQVFRVRSGSDSGTLAQKLTTDLTATSAPAE